MAELVPHTSFRASLRDLAATEALAGWVAARVAAGDVIALWGGLGAGKTAFPRPFIPARRGGDGVPEVPTPPFPLVQPSDLAPPVWHFDLYRLTRADEVWELGLED